jgi:hypothetical protein
MDAETITGPLRGPLRKRESHLWEREANDHYVEPAWCSERLFEIESFGRDTAILDPACGFGTIVEAARAAGYHALGSDIIARWESAHLSPRSGLYRIADFLAEEWPPVDSPGWTYPNAIISNPPFKLAERFAAKALLYAQTKVALLLPANWIQGQKRSRWMQTTPLYRVYFICPRPSMPPGHVVSAGLSPRNGTTDYAWFVWLKGFSGQPSVHWLYRDEAAAS